MINKYVKKPIVIEAVQWNGLNYQEISDFIGTKVTPELYSDAAYIAGVAPPSFSIKIPTLEGEMMAISGDYIIKGIAGEFYPCKCHIFEKTYDLVDGAQEG